MKKETLLKARTIIIEALSKVEQDIDTLELIININHFLEPKDYENNIKILSKRKLENMKDKGEYKVGKKKN